MKNMKKQKDKKMTIDGLAVLMKEGFSGIDKKFNRIDKKLETNQEEMATMVKNAFQGNQEYMDRNFKALGEDLHHAHYKLDKIDKKLDGQEKTIFDHDQKIDRIEVELKLKKA